MDNLGAIAASIAAIIGAVTGTLALLGLVYALGGKFTRLETRVDALWKVFMEGAMYRQTKEGNILRSSDVLPAPTLLALIQQTGSRKAVATIKALAAQGHRGRTEADIALDIIKAMGWPLVVERAKERDIPVEAYLARAVAVYNLFRANPNALDVEALPKE